jgi:DNA helicase-2/ATP-dependent DNA helicase PcrA
MIQRLKSRLVLPEDAHHELSDPVTSNRIALIYAAYESQLREHNALDFDSLILRTYELFRRYPAFAKRYRSVYTHICLEEFQDTNTGQYGLLRALTGDRVSDLFVVADDDQVMYEWNGASRERIDALVSDYGASVLQLPLSYRCPAEIVSIANSLIQHNSTVRLGSSQFRHSSQAVVTESYGC